MKAILSAALYLSLLGTAVSQTVIEPEACILDTLKGSPAKETTAMVRFNCVRQYIKAVQSQVVGVSTEKFESSTLQHIPGFPPVIAESLVVTLKNDSNVRVVMADIEVVNKKTKVKQTFRGYADFPIEPFSVGEIQAMINLRVANFDKYSWSFASVWGVPVR